MANTNCLAGIKCPQCGYEDKFRIECHVVMTVTDEGTEDIAGDVEWQDESWCVCANCERQGELRSFRIPEAAVKPSPRGGTHDAA